VLAQFAVDEQYAIANWGIVSVLHLCRLANASSKNDDMEAAIAQVGIEVYSAMDAATA
jgi:hypothetical protein